MSSNSQQTDPHALPPPSTLTLPHHGHSTWNFLLRAEQRALNQPSTSTSAIYNTDLVAVRVLGHLLADFWGHSGQHAFFLSAYEGLVEAIDGCRVVEDELRRQYEYLLDLGILYRNRIMGIFRPYNEWAPLPGTPRPESPPSFAGTLKDINTVSKTKSEAKTKALVRDGYRCMICGVFDVHTLESDRELMKRARAGTLKVKAGHTQCVHLFPEPVPPQDGEESVEDGTAAYEILRSFGLGDFADELENGQGVHDLRNVMTMSMVLRTQFDEHNFWLEEVPGQPHTYDIHAPPHSMIPYLVELQGIRRVTFALSQDVIDAVAPGGPLPPLPDPRLIAVRASCARVARASGAVQQMKQVLSDMEDSTVLAGDGSAAEVLAARLSYASIVPTGA
ncbi:hypothetical protein PLICRDRAFT_610912 [Plicaturopsis crispa FD-325 SS-3]|nr:hypothetical protein PLICRDRAFT_610912 [Plicaturopsis crispa FD-325 SS-3]